ncbi:hypothetical protein LVJ94_09850 [Pendulispora rubella]|uniref:Calcineurin-like phosphoesterase domain-containing protein n=1 Tax=Pendulispora rubella TaxID=2741070 RepID=A0ABZ2L9D9_9BACT
MSNAAPPSERRSNESLLILSDVHLGSDLHDQARTTGFGRRSKQVDDDLVRLLEHYRSTPPLGERWRLVIAGDFIDFIGMSLPAPVDELTTEPSEEELAHGLGNAEDHARIKMRRVGERHVEVFTALASFVADGHKLTIVHGNHDVEFHWDAVKEEFKKILAASAPPGTHEATFLARVEFNPWFFYVPDLAYIEHGHMYDPFCATSHVMAPLSPLDPRRIARGFCDVLLRFVVRPTKGLPEYGHENLGIVDYVKFGVGLGLGGMVKLGLRFFRAVCELFRLRRGYFTEAAETLRKEHDRRVAAFGEKMRIGTDRLRALAALQVQPVTSSIRGIMASVLLDRIALAMAGTVALLGVGYFLGVKSGHAAYGAALVVGTWVGAHLYLARLRKVDPAEELVDRAAKLARLFPAAFVVMGHTHIPTEVPVQDGVTYINLGSWAEDEEVAASDKHVAYQAARTHLVIHPRESGTEAQFLAWDSTTAGPRRFKGTGSSSA